MPVVIKDAQAIKLLRNSCILAAQVLDYIKQFVQVGVTTKELNDLCHNYIVKVQEAYPSPLNYNPMPQLAPAYPFSICTSVNDEICHGFPLDKKLKDADIVNIDVTVYKNGYHGDSSRMFYVGNPSKEAQRLCEVTYNAMWHGILQVKPGNRLGDIGFAIQKYVESNNYSVVQEFCGHGIGKDFHEDPYVLHYGEKNTGMVLKSGMSFTIEPMVNQKSRDIKIQDNKWTAVTRDGGLSAQWEHTVLVTDNSFEVLTISKDMPKIPKFVYEK